MKFKIKFEFKIYKMTYSKLQSTTAYDVSKNKSSVWIFMGIEPRSLLEWDECLPGVEVWCWGFAGVAE